MIKKAPRKKGIRTDLVLMWRIALRNILWELGKRQEDFAKKIGLSRQSLSTMLQRDDLHLTGIQFLGTMRGLEEMIRESDADQIRKNAAWSYWEQVDAFYHKFGFRE